ncbi:MAG: hypothetical protein U0003_03890 [Vampirovibrionales bacterium]
MTTLPIATAEKPLNQNYTRTPLEPLRDHARHLFHQTLHANYGQPPSSWSHLHQTFNTQTTPVNSHQLGQAEGTLKMLGGATIALLTILAQPFPAVGATELLGFVGFFGTMAATPRAIRWLVEKKTGLNQNWNYISTQGDRRWLFEDVGYLPTHLIPDEDIERVGNKLGIPHNTPNRRSIIEDRIKQITAQSQTLWMLLAGPLTPLIASGLAHTLASTPISGIDQPAKRLTNYILQLWHQLALKLYPQKSQALGTRLLDTIVGSSPITPLSRWWPKAQQGLATHSGFTQFVAQRLKEEKRSLSSISHVQWSEWLERFIAESLDAAAKNNSSEKHFNKLVQHLTPLRNQVEAEWPGRIDQLINKALGGNQLHNEINQLRLSLQESSASNTSSLEALLKEKETLLAIRQQLATEARSKLNNASGFLQQIERAKRTLLGDVALKKRSQVLSPHIIREILWGNHAGNLTEALATGDHTTLQRLLGGLDDKMLYKWLGHLGRKEFQQAQWTIGPTLGSQFILGAQQALKVSYWRNRVFGWLGGGLALGTALYYQFILGRSFKPQSTETTTAKEMLAKYNKQGEFETLQQSIALSKVQRTQLPPRSTLYEQPGYLKSLFHQRKVVTYALNLRTFGAKDLNNDGLISPHLFESGTFLNAIERLDELKALGINNIHVLPVNPIGTLKRKGMAGSIYAVADLHTLNPQLADPRSPLNIYQQARLFVQECHKRGIQVMMDIPSIASIDLAITRPDLIAVDEHGRTQTPTTWTDGVVLKNDAKLLEYYQGFFDLMVNDLGVDGFRADVARFRPEWFWKHFINQYPNKAWVAETYTPEDASPLEGIPRDNPHQLLGYGFDAIYGQFHTFHQMKSGQEYTQYLTKELPTITHTGAQQGGVSPLTKSAWASYLTHDDETTPMEHGGVEHALMIANLTALTPNATPYILDGQQTGYDKRIDIFNYTPSHIGQHPEAGTVMAQALSVRKTYSDVFSSVSVPYILPIKGDPSGQLFAWTLEAHGKRLLLIGNKTPNARTEGTLELPSGWLKTATQNGKPLQNLLLEYGRQCRLAATGENQLTVSLGPSRVLLFDVSSPSSAPPTFNH